MPTRTTNPPRHHRAALTLIGMVAVLVVLTVMLGTLTLVNRALRHEAAEAETRQTLLALQSALRAYADEHGTAPTGDAAAALAAIQSHPPAAQHLAGLRIEHHDDHTPQVLDGFGRPLRYQAPDHTHGQPASFVSAGRSGRFGRLSTDRAHALHDADVAPHRRAAADNLYGYELETFTP